MALSRRKFLQVLGIGAGAAVAAPALVEAAKTITPEETIIPIAPVDGPSEAGDLLAVVDDEPVWVRPSYFSNPMTTVGDIIIPAVADGPTPDLSINGLIPIWRAPEYTRPPHVYYTLAFDPKKQQVMTRVLEGAWEPLGWPNEKTVLQQWSKYHDISQYGLTLD